MLEQLRPRFISSKVHDTLVAGMNGRLQEMPIFMPEHPDIETVEYAMALNMVFSDAGAKVFQVPQRMTPEMSASLPIGRPGVTLLVKRGTTEFKEWDWLFKLLAEDGHVVNVGARLGQGQRRANNNTD